MADFSKDRGDVQGTSANSTPPKHSGTPKTGFTEAPEGPNRSDFGPGPGVKGNTKKIK